MSATTLLRYPTALIKWFSERSLLQKLLILTVIVGLSWIARSLLTSTKTSSPVYQTAIVEKGTLVVSISTSGTVSTANSANVTTNAAGVVKAVYVKNGDQVKVGQKNCRY